MLDTLWSILVGSSYILTIVVIWVLTLALISGTLDTYRKRRR